MHVHTCECTFTHPPQAMQLSPIARRKGRLTIATAALIERRDVLASSAYDAEARPFTGQTVAILLTRERSDRSQRMTPNAHQHLVVFARQPTLGKVKTRLAATVGDARALAIYTTLAERVVAALAGRREWKLAVCCAPDAGCDDVARWLGGGVTVEPQGEGDLGRRMSRALDAHLAQGAGRVVIIGTDCPDVGSEIVRKAFTALETHDLVYGPALDGGYYLVGARRPVPEVFVDVPWSSSETLAISLERARSAGYSAHLLEPLGDIDTEDDWRAWQERSTHPVIQSAFPTDVRDEPLS